VKKVIPLFLCGVLVGGQFLLMDCRLAMAQSVIATDDLVKALADKKPAQMSSVEIEAQKSVKAVLTDVSKSVKIESSVKIKIDKSAQKDYVPAIDLAVYFDFDSAEITDKAKATLDPLSRALQSPSLKGATIVLAGFTDAAGKFDYNKDLSQRRATAVKGYLVSGHGMPAQQLVDVGFGELHLKDPNDPKSAVNRRVQIINLGQ
jgi:outer membrane protein OmpA-like peptidoglycan-associated protein